MCRAKKGAVLIEVLVALFITSIVFIAVYTTISVSLVNTRYLQQVRKTADFCHAGRGGVCCRSQRRRGVCI